jgi:hypothetical protein
MKTPDTKDFLSRALDEWRITPRRSPNLRAATWARIEATRAGRTWLEYAAAHRTLVASLAVVALLVGGWIGRERAQLRREVDRAQLAESYVRSLDARTMQLQ